MTQQKKNKYFFGLGTVGRDMFYAFESNAMIYFLSNILHLPLTTFAMVSLVLTILRVFDALNDPITGLIIDNVRSPWGKYKPPMLVGCLLAVVFYLIMFADFGFTDIRFVLIFSVAYILWDISYGINDIAYWSMMTSLSLDQKERESIGAFARICANIGMFIVMIGYPAFTEMLGGGEKGYFLLAVVCSVMMILFQLFTIIGVKENKEQFVEEEKTSIKDMFGVLFKNDQLMWVTLSMALFTVGYISTTSFALYYMQYIYGDIDKYAILAAACGVAQLLALIIFPYVSKLFKRKTMYGISTAIVVIGYVLFFFADKSLIMIAVAAVIIFIGEAFIQLLMLMFLADTIEYGQWKLGKRNDSITFSIQPLINKIGGAFATGIVSITLMITGIKQGDVAATKIDDVGKLLFKNSMLIAPLILIAIGYYIYIKKFELDEERYSQIVEELKQRGDIRE
ncbi:MAG: MFS transporter [Erysipelotrichaceae bacterium]|nr:MFS transporter [Erysipelotrichaceae bacterium]MBQ6492390.1 MFS transporter [Erysipelotrichaceae bacterium]